MNSVMRVYFALVLMDLSKAFDKLNHDLLIEKLHAYRCTREIFKTSKDYLSSRYQRTEVNNAYSTWEKLLTAVAQGSFLGPLLLNIYLNDMFCIIEPCISICNSTRKNNLRLPYCLNIILRYDNIRK